MHRSFKNITSTYAGILLCMTIITITSFVYSPLKSVFAASPQIVYVDCSLGDDSNSGTSSNQAWQSLSRASQANLAPGSSLLLARDCSWTEPLEVRWQGTMAQPITVGAYGSGALPTIQNNSDNVYITGSYLVIENIATRADAPAREVDCQNQGVGWRIGFKLETNTSYVTLRGVKASGMTHGVLISASSHHNKILNSTLENNNLMFILDRARGTDSGAVGIVVRGDDNEIANNTISGSDACSYDYGRDGSAVEIYGGQRNRIHHNVARNNNAFSELGDSRSADTIYAYNLVTASISKAQFLVTRGGNSSRGPVLRTRAYNNTVYLSSADSFGVNCDGGCTKDILVLKNNILWVEGTLGYSDQAFGEGYNLYWRGDGNPKVWFNTVSSSSKKADPQFVDRGAGNLHIKSSSPAVDSANSDASNNGYTSDLDTVPVPQQAAADRGVFEYATRSPQLPVLYTHSIYLPLTHS